MRGRRGAAAGGRGPVAGVGAGRRGLVAAHRECAQVGRAGRGGAARRTEGCEVRPSRPGGRAGVGARRRFRERPGDRGRRGLAAGRTGRGRGRVGTAARSRGPDQGLGGRAGDGRRGGRRSGATAAASRDVLLSLCRRGDSAARVGYGRFLRVIRFVLHQQHADAQSCAAGDGGALGGERTRLAAARRGGGGRRPVPGGAAGRGPFRTGAAGRRGGAARGPVQGAEAGPPAEAAAAPDRAAAAGSGAAPRRSWSWTRSGSAARSR